MTTGSSTASSSWAAVTFTAWRVRQFDDVNNRREGMAETPAPAGTSTVTVTAPVGREFNHTS